MRLWQEVCSIKMNFDLAIKDNNPFKAQSFISSNSLEFDTKSMSFILEQKVYIDLFNKLNSSIINYDLLKVFYCKYEALKTDILKGADKQLPQGTNKGKITVEPSERNELNIYIKGLDEHCQRTIDSLSLTHSMIHEFLDKKHNASGLKSEVHEDFLKYDIKKSFATNHPKQEQVHA